MLGELKSKLDKAVAVLRIELNKVQAGRASASLVDGLNVDVYGSIMPLNQIANVTVPDSKTVAIQPWDKANLAPIEQSITKSDIGLNPVNDGVVIRISIPPLSAERREELVRIVRGKAENAKISVRTIRQDVFNKISAQEKNKEIGEDDAKRQQSQVQAEVDKYNSDINKISGVKETEITTV